MADYLKKVFQNTLIVFILSIVSAGMAYLLRFILARNLSVEEYGLFYAGFALIGTFIIIRDFGLRTALVKFIPELNIKKEYGRLKGVIVFIFFFHLLMSVILAAIMLLFNIYFQQYYFHVSNIDRLVILFAIIFLLSFFEEIIMYSIQGFQHMGYYSLIEPMRLLCVVFITMIFFFIGKGIYSPLYGYITAYALLPIIHFIYFRNKAFPVFCSTRTEIVQSQIRKVMKFGLICIVSSTGGFIFLYADTIFVSLLTDVTQVGLYQTAVPTAMLVMFLGVSLSKVILPLISELWTKKKKTLISEGIELAHKYILVVTIPFAAIPIIFPEIMLRIFFGEKYVGAATSLSILAVGIVFLSIKEVNEQVYKGIDKPEAISRIIMVFAFLNIILNLVLIPLLGIAGAAITTATCYAGISIVSTFFLKRYAQFREPWIHWIKTIISGVMMMFLMTAVKKVIEVNPYIEIIITGLICFSFYTLMLFALKVLKMEEIRTLFQNATRKR